MKHVMYEFRLIEVSFKQHTFVSSINDIALTVETPSNSSGFTRRNRPINSHQSDNVISHGRRSRFWDIQQVQ